VRDDIRAMALQDHGRERNPHQASDVDLLLLSDRADEYRRRRKWLTEIDFTGAAYRRQWGESSTYSVFWSRHIHLLPKSEVETTFADCA